MEIRKYLDWTWFKVKGYCHEGRNPYTWVYEKRYIGCMIYIGYWCFDCVYWGKDWKKMGRKIEYGSKDEQNKGVTPL